jgi:hypothetical protein
VTPIKLIAAPRKLKYSGKRAFAAFLLLTAFTPGRTQNATSDPATGEDFFSKWFGMVSKARAEQPHWMTPLVTVTPRLEQEYRYDQSMQYKAGKVLWPEVEANYTYYPNGEHEGK